jgi:hypothetical protein
MDKKETREMAEAQGPREGDTPPPDAPATAERGEREWSQWERQKVDVYRQEHPDAPPAATTREEGEQLA